MESIQNVIRQGVDFSKYAAVMSDHSAANTTDRYAFIPTTRVVDILKSQDWHPVKVMEARTNKEERHGFQKHLIRFRHSENMNTSLELNAEIPEIVLTNSHDGLTAFNIMSGLYRLVCSNGLIVADSTFSNHRIKHMGFKDDQVIDAVYSVVEETPRIISRVNEFKNIELSAKDRDTFAEAALMLKVDEDKMPEGQDKDFAIQRILRPTRVADATPTLWNTYNTIQEKFIKGGRFIPDAKTGIVKKSREVKSVSENVRLNKALWFLTEKMAENKTIQV